jgi:hypothetical protein
VILAKNQKTLLINFKVAKKYENKNIKLMMAVIMMRCFLVYRFCQKAVAPIHWRSCYTSGKVQLEKQKQAEKSLAQVKCQELCQQKWRMKTRILISARA